jgi:hypothetical protein
MCRFAIVITLLLAVALPVGLAQQQRTAEPEYDVKKCTPKVVHRKPLPNAPPITVRKGEKSTGYPPVIAFEILDSGELANAHVKRTSGVADIDAYALNWISGIKYNSRPGCATLESEATVLVDFF